MKRLREIVVIALGAALVSSGSTGSASIAAYDASVATDNLAFIRDGEIHLTRIGSSQSRRLTRTDGGVSEVIWSPDGHSLAFVRLYESQSSRDPSPSQVYSIGADGTGIRRLTPRLPDVVGLSWSRDGRTLAFWQRRPGIHVVTMSGGGPRSLAADLLLPPDAPSWARDGRKLAVSAYIGPAIVGRRSIFVVETGGGRPQRLTKGADDARPSWSPDGRQLLYQRFHCAGSPCESVIRVMNVAGRAHRALVRVATSGGSLTAWSPDGGTIAFTQRAQFNDEIWSISVDSRRKRRLATNTYGPGPAWSPDGRKIAFVRDNSIFVMNADGSAERRIVPNATSPAWRPTP